MSLISKARSITTPSAPPAPPPRGPRSVRSPLGCKISSQTLSRSHQLSVRESCAPVIAQVMNPDTGWQPDHSVDVRALVITDDPESVWYPPPRRRPLQRCPEELQVIQDGVVAADSSGREGVQVDALAVDQRHLEHLRDRRDECKRDGSRLPPATGRAQSPIADQPCRQPVRNATHNCGGSRRACLDANRCRFRGLCLNCHCRLPLIPSG